MFKGKLSDSNMAKSPTYEFSKTFSHSGVFILNSEKLAGFKQDISGVLQVKRHGIRRNTAVCTMSTTPYSDELGPEYLAFCAVFVNLYIKEDL